MLIRPIIKHHRRHLSSWRLISSRLKQQDLPVRILAEPARYNRSGAAGAHDDKVVIVVRQRFVLDTAAHIGDIATASDEVVEDGHEDDKGAAPARIGEGRADVRGCGARTLHSLQTRKMA